MKRLLVVSVFAVVALTAAVETASAYAFNPWTTMTGKGTFVINPFVGGTFSGGTPFYVSDLVLEYGISDYADIFTSVMGWAMVRFDLSKGNNTGILGIYGDAGKCGVQWDFYKDISDKFTLEANVDAFLPYADPVGSMNFSAYIAPVLKLTPSFALYCEIDPAYTLGTAGGFGLNIVPGVWFQAGDGQLSLGVTLANVTSGTIDVSYGAWYWIPFTIK